MSELISLVSGEQGSVNSPEAPVSMPRIVDIVDFGNPDTAYDPTVQVLEPLVITDFGEPEFSLDWSPTDRDNGLLD